MADNLISETGTLKAFGDLNLSDKIEIEQGADPTNESNHTDLENILARLRTELRDSDVPADIETEAGTTRTLALTDRGKYMRWTSTGAKTLTVNTDTGGAAGEYHVRNAAVSGDLQLSASGVTINAPKGGTLFLEPGDTATLKRVGSNAFDLLGSTKAA